MTSLSQAAWARCCFVSRFVLVEGILAACRQRLSVAGRDVRGGARIAQAVAGVNAHSEHIEIFQSGSRVARIRVLF